MTQTDEEIKLWQTLKENDVFVYEWTGGDTTYTVIAKSLGVPTPSNKIGTKDIYVALGTTKLSVVEIDFNDGFFTLKEILYNEKSSLEILKETRPDLMV